MEPKEILIVDDDEDLSFIISDMLTSYGYQVTCVSNSETAYEKLSTHSYHLILLDINLPNYTGFEVCQELRRVSTVPVIFASARTSEFIKQLDLLASNFGTSLLYVFYYLHWLEPSLERY